MLIPFIASHNCNATSYFLIASEACYQHRHAQVRLDLHQLPQGACSAALQQHLLGCLEAEQGPPSEFEVQAS
jgi:hypothetical protein